MLKRILCLLFALCTLFLASCRTKPQEGTDEVCFTDALGREVRVRCSPERVAALIGSFADVWMLAGGEVCATADDAWDDFALPLSSETVNLGGTKSPNVELLLAAKPDFVIASASTAGNVALCDLLEQIGITVAYFEVSCFDEYLHMLDICTDITGRKDLYRQYGTRLQQDIDRMCAQFTSATGEDRPTVLFLRASAGYIRAKNSRGSILGEMLCELGCENIADSDASLLETLGLESILAADPSHIFIVQVGDDAEGVRQAVESMMTQNPAWQQLRAVREDRIYYMDKRLFNLKPNARWAEAYEKLIGILQETT